MNISHVHVRMTNLSFYVGQGCPTWEFEVPMSSVERAVDGLTKVRVKFYQARVVKLGKTTIYQPKIR
jgi:hypothetical protein